jgi:hypothetical protein
MKYYDQNDLMLVFGLIVISYFTLRYLMTRKLLEGQSNKLECESVEADLATSEDRLEEAQSAKEDASQTLREAQASVDEAQASFDGAQTSFDEAQTSVDDAQASVDDAQASVEECRFQHSHCEINSWQGRLVPPPNYIVTGDSCVKENKNKNLRCHSIPDQYPEICKDKKQFFCKNGTWTEVPGTTNSFKCFKKYEPELPRPRPSGTDEAHPPGPAELR